MAKVFCLDQHNNYVETMTKEQIISAIQTAATGGALEGFSNTAIVSKIKEVNKNADFSVWVGTAAEYNKITTKLENVLYILSDDPLASDLPNKVNNLKRVIDDFDVALQGVNRVIQEREEATATQAAQVEENKKEIAAHKTILDSYGKQIKANNEQLARLGGVGFVTLYDELNENYTSVSGIPLAEDYDAFDFLIFEFEEIPSGTEEVAWRARAVLPTINLSGNTKHGLYFTFLATSTRTTVRFDSGEKRKLYFSGTSGNNPMKLVAIYGYNRKGGE